MINSITAHKFAQLQHAEYEAQAAHHFASAKALKENKLALIVGKISTFIHQARKSLARKSLARKSLARKSLARKSTVNHGNGQVAVTG